MTKKYDYAEIKDIKKPKAPFKLTQADLIVVSLLLACLGMLILIYKLIVGYNNLADTINTYCMLKPAAETALNLTGVSLP